MYINKDQYRQLALNSPNGYNNANWVGVERSQADKVWRIVCVHKLTSEENDRNHHCYVDLLDSTGNFLLKPQERLAFSWKGQRPDEKSSPIVLDKPANETVGNVPIWKGAEFEVWIDSPYPSDKATGLTTNLPDDGEGNRVGHHSYYIIWQLQEKKVTVDPKPVEPIKPVVDDIKMYVEVAGVLNMLEALRSTTEAYLRGLGRTDEVMVLNSYFAEAVSKFKVSLT